MNRNFTIYTASGEILRVGTCPEDDWDLQAQPGEFIIDAQADPAKDSVDPVTGQVVAGGRPPPPPPTYDVLRKAEYPALGDQFDMFWHAMDSGVIPKIQPFYDDIKAVKEKYPKP